MAAPHPPLDLASVTARLSRLTMPADAGDDPGPRAAVAAILREGGGGDAEVLLIRRAEHPDDPWSGHMAFPGGRRHEEDRSDADTAIRETREEVGVDSAAHGSLVTRLADVAAVARGKRTGLTIAPFVFALHAEVALTFDPAEVSEAIWAPLGPLARGEGGGTMRYEVEGQVIVLPCLDVAGHRVWGLTYRMLQLLFEAIGQERLQLTPPRGSGRGIPVRVPDALPCPRVEEVQVPSERERREDSPAGGDGRRRRSGAQVLLVAGDWVEGRAGAHEVDVRVLATESEARLVPVRREREDAGAPRPVRRHPVEEVDDRAGGPVEDPGVVVVQAVDCLPAPGRRSLSQIHARPSRLWGVMRTPRRLPSSQATMPSASCAWRVPPAS